MFKNFTSAAASITSKATEQALAAAEIAKNSAIQTASNYLPPSEACFSCGKVVSVTQNITKIGTLIECICCGNKFCKKCLQKNTIPVPDHLLTAVAVAVAVDSKNSSTVRGIGYICKSKCFPECVAYWMSDITKQFEILTNDIMQNHFQNTSSDLKLYQKPESILDSKTRKAKRLLYLAEYAAEIIGIDTYFKVIKFAAMGTGALSVILQGDTAKVLYPLMECLKQFGIEGNFYFNINIFLILIFI